MINDKKRFLSKNNHSYHINKQIKNCNEFFKIYLIQRTKYRLIITRRLFKFRRKKSSHHIKVFNQLNHLNNNHLTIQETSKTSIQQILNRQWIQTFKQTKSERKINHEESIFADNHSYSIDSVNPSNNQVQQAYRLRNMYGLNQMIRSLK